MPQAFLATPRRWTMLPLVGPLPVTEQMRDIEEVGWR